MAVSIDEMQVDVNDAGSKPASASPSGGQGGNVDVRAALEVMLERELRLKTD